MDAEKSNIVTCTTLRAFCVPWQVTCWTYPNPPRIYRRQQNDQRNIYGSPEIQRSWTSFTIFETLCNASMVGVILKSKSLSINTKTHSVQFLFWAVKNSSFQRAEEKLESSCMNRWLYTNQAFKLPFQISFGPPRFLLNMSKLEAWFKCTCDICQEGMFVDINFCMASLP